LFTFTLISKAKIVITLQSKVIIDVIMEKKFRSSCLIASALDLIGDKWSLLIIRDMLLYQKKTFKELIASDEGVASNLLSGRLKLLIQIGLLTKQKLPTNKKENIYLLTEKGIALAPLIMEVVIWSDKYVREHHAAMNAYETHNIDKALVVANVQKEYAAFAKGIVEA